MKNTTITETLKATQTDKFIRSLWYDWFCSDLALFNRGKSLLSKLNAISKSTKFDNDKTYVFFKNNSPCFGRLYDDFRICDIETGDVIYTITPKSGHRCDNGLGSVYGKENGFKEPLVKGSWKEIKEWFNKESVQ